MLAPEVGVEVESDEFDGATEALAGWDVGRRSFEGLRMAGKLRAGRFRMAGKGRINSIRQYGSDWSWVPVRLPGSFVCLVSGCYG